MNVSIITSLRNLLVPALSLVVLTQCGEKKPSPMETVPAETPEAVSKPPEAKRERLPLEKIVQGIWETSDPSQLEEVGSPEKIQIDFRANGEMTMIIYNKGESRSEGVYEVKGDELFLRIKGQEDDSVKTRYDGETLVVIDVASDTEMDFQKL